MKLLIFFVLVGAVYSSTRIYFTNLCDHEFPVIRTIELWNRTWISVEVVLKPNETKHSSYPLSFAWPNMNFRANYSGKTAAEFFLNTGGYDFYGINIFEGFDVDMSVVPDDGFNVSCHSDNCPDGMKTPEDWRGKMRWTPAKAEFTVTFCAPVKIKNKEKNTALVFHNQCNKAILIVDVDKHESGMVVQRLRPGFYFVNTDGIEGSFKAGIRGTTRVDLELNRNGLDYYSISVQNGFDHPVRVRAVGGTVLTCTNWSCSDGIHNPWEYNEKVRTRPTAGMIYITWCPAL